MANKQYTIGINFDINKQNLDSLNKSLDDIINKARQTEKTLPNYAEPFTEAAEAAKTLKEVLNSAWNPSIGQIDFSKLQAGIVKSYGSMKEFKTQLKQIGPEATTAFQALRNAVIQTNVPIKQTSKLLDQMADTFGKTIRYGIASSVWNNFSNSVSRAYGYVKDLDKSLNDIRIVSGASAKEMEKLAVSANKTAQALGNSTLDYTKAALIYYQQGLPTDEVEERTNITLKMANVLHTSASEVSDYMTAIWNNFANGTETLEHYADVITALGAATAASSEEIATGLEKFAAVGETVGLSYETATSALATVVAKTRQSADTVGTAFKTIFARIQDLELGKTLEDGTTLGKYAEALSAVGISLKDENGELKKMDVTLKEMGAKWKEMSKDQQVAFAQAVAGTRQYTQLVSLLENWDDVELNLNIAESSEGTLQKQQEIYLDSLDAHLEKMGAAWEGLYNNIFDEDTLKLLTDALTGIINLTNSFVKSLGGGLNSLIYLASTLAAVMNKQLASSMTSIKKNWDRINEIAAKTKLVQDIYDLSEDSAFNVQEVFTKGIKEYKEQQIQENQLWEIKTKLNEADQRNLAIVEDRLKALRETERILNRLQDKRDRGPDLGKNATGKNNQERAELQEKIRKQDTSKGITETDRDIEDFEARKGINSEKILNNQQLLEKLSEGHNAQLEFDDIKQLNAIKSAMAQRIGKQRQALAKYNEQINGQEFGELDKEFFRALAEQIEQLKIEKEALEDVINEYQSKNLVKAKSGEDTFDYRFTKSKKDEIKSKGENTISVDTEIRDLSLIQNAITDQQNHLQKNLDDNIESIRLLKALKQDELTLDEQLAMTGKARAEAEGQIAMILDEQNSKERLQDTIIGLSTVMTTLSSINGIISTWTSDDLSFFEKLSSSFMNLAPTITMLIMNWNKVWDALRNINAGMAQSIVYTEALTAGKTKEIVATEAIAAAEAVRNKESKKTIIQNAVELVQEKIKVALKTIELVKTKQMSLITKEMLLTTLGIGAAIAAILVALGYGIYKLIQINSEQYKLNKEIERSTQALEDAKQAYQELSDTISNYKNAQESISGLTEGTIEFYEAIIKANAEAQKLIDTWNLVMDKDFTIDKNGLITINQDSLQEHQLQDQQKVYAAQAIKNTADLKKAEYTLDKEYQKVAREIANETWKQTGKIVELNTEQVKTIFSDKQGENLGNVQLYNQRAANVDLGLGNTVNLGEIVKNYQADISQMEARIQALQDQQLGNSIRAYGTTEQMQAFNSSSTTRQEAWRNYVKSQQEKDKKKTTSGTGYIWGDTTVGLAEGMATGASAGAYVGTLGGPIGSGAGAIIGGIIGAIAGGLGGYALGKAEQQGIQNDYKKQYAKDLGYTENNGIWYDRSGNIIDEKELLDSFDFKDVQKAIEEGLVATGEANKKVMEEISKANKYAYEYRDANFSKSEQQRVVDAIAATQFGGTNFDYDVLTDAQRQAVIAYVENIEVDPEALNQLKNAVYDATKAAIADFKEYNETLKSGAEELEISEAAMNLYAGAVMNANKEMANYNQLTAQAIVQEAKFNKVYNEGIKTFKDAKDGYEQYINAIKKGQVPSLEAAESAGKIQENLEELSGLKLSSNFLMDSSIEDDIKTLYEGSEEEAEKAYNNLYAKMQKDSATLLLQNSDYFKEILKSTTGGDNVVEGWNNLYNEVSGYIDQINQLNPGDTLDSKFSEKLLDMVNNAHYTKDQVEDLFSAMHIEMPEIETDWEEPTVEEIAVPENAVIHRYEGDYPTGKIKDGKMQTKPIKYQWTEYTAAYKQKYVKFDKSKSLKKDLSSSSNFTVSGKFAKAPSNTGGGSEPNQKDLIDTEIDRYHKVNTQITKVDNSLKKLQSQQEKFVGSKLLSNLNAQWADLNTQIDNYNEKLRIANEEQAELANKLSAKGVTFNADGTVNNYTEAIRAQEAYVNSLIDNYNHMSADAQKKYEESTLKPAEEAFEQFKTDIDRYDELISSFIPDIKQSIQDSLDKQIEINITKFNLEIEITLDMDQATRDWNAWAKRAIQGFDAEDIFGNAQARLKDFYTYFNEQGTADVQVGMKHVNETLEELRKLNANENGVFGDANGNKKKALEQLKEHYTQLMQSITDVIELQDELHQDWLDKMDEVQEKFSKQVSAYEFLRNVLDHDIKLIQMNLGEDAYAEMAKFYDAQQKNYEKQLEFQRQQKDFWYAQMQAAEEGSKEWESAREKWQDAVNEFNSILESGLENAKTKFENAINDIFKKLNDLLTGGLGLEYVNTQWDLINKNADRYLDTINSTYAIRELEKKYIDSINKTNNVATQQRLQKVMDEQLENLKQRERLTQYDVDRANKLYEIEMARIALEEAQKNKSQMRLRRDSQGNYSYQYVADDAAISEAEDQLSGLYNDLYNFDKERYNSVLNDIYSTWSEYQEQMAAAALINDPELRAEKQALIQKEYNELMMQIETDYQTSKYNLQESFFTDWVNLNDMTLESFKNLTDNEKDIIMTEMVPTWKNGITEMIEMITGEGGFVAVTQSAWENMVAAEKEYTQDITNLENVSQQTFDAIAQGQDENIARSQELIKQNDELIDAYGKELQAVKEIYDQVKALRDMFKETEQAAIATAEAAYKALHQEQEQAQSDYANQNASTSSSSSNPSGSSDIISGVTGGGGAGGSGNGSPEAGDTATYNGGKYYSTSYGGGSWGSRSSGTQVRITIVKAGRPYPIHIANLNGGALGWIREDQISGYDTGGYTGTWNNNGRLALLHQKELVLNAQDTENMLNAVSVMRSLAYSLGSSVLARMAGVGANGINGGGATDGVLEQNVHIEAEFPNVHNAAEIEEALNNLVNSASQRVMEKR